MTHDELLIQLEGLWHDSYKAPGYQALRAVVELCATQDEVTIGDKGLFNSGRNSMRDKIVEAIERIFDEIYQGRLERDARNYDSKSQLRRIEITTGIKTQAGLEMFKYFNDNYGSSVWGKVLEGIKNIEEELK